MAQKKKALRERLAQKRKELANRGKLGPYLIQKEEGTLRVRLLPVGEENEFGFEITQFYLGDKVKAVVSPSTIGEPCPILEKYNELKDSKDPSDKALAKKMSPRKRTLIPVIVYEDLKGKRVDTEKSKENGTLLLVTSSVYAQMLDNYLDEDDWGDFTDQDNGYDFKITRTGKGQFDTEYSCNPCPKSPLPKPYYGKLVNLEEKIREIIPTYEEAMEKLAEFLNESSDDSDEPEERPAKRAKKKKTSTNDL